MRPSEKLELLKDACSILDNDATSNVDKNFLYVLALAIKKQTISSKHLMFKLFKESVVFGLLDSASAMTYDPATKKSSSIVKISLDCLYCDSLVDEN